MPIVRQKWITRANLRANPGSLYLFGDNCLRVGYGGQAREMRGEPNAVGVRTKRAPGLASMDFFYDHEYDECVAMIDEDLERVERHLRSGGTVVVPEDGLGTGLSALPVSAPRVYAYLVSRLEALETV